MASRKRQTGTKRTAKAPETRIQSAEKFVQTLADGAFEIAEEVTGRIDKVADAAFDAAEKVAGETANDVRKIYRSVSDTRNKSIEVARKQARRWVSALADLVSERSL